MKDCVFCLIVPGAVDSSIVFEDNEVMAFMTLRPTRRGEFLVIPKLHIDLWIDVPDDLSAWLFRVNKEYGRRAFLSLTAKPDRMGLVIHGYGVPHAHLIVVPQYDPTDIRFGRQAVCANG
jgi:histidine triad (HIT) family protein